LEPPGEASAALLSSCDLAFLPGVAFDRWGGRLGRGAGYYDRALSKPRAELPFLCGLSYAFQVVDRVPMGPHDIRVDAVASETAWFEACCEPGELRE
jgi:5-formyltetrahydrofolate cyclo-ligase